MSKNKKIIISVVSCVVALAIIGTVLAVAFFTASDTAENQFTVATPVVTVVEDPEDGPYEWTEDSKSVWLRNDSENLDGYVRCTVFPVILNADGNIVNTGTSSMSEPQEIDGQMVIAFGDIYLVLADNDSWEDNWIYADGYFYYREKLSAGEETTPLISGVILSPDADIDEYADYTIDIEVFADIIQEEAITVDNSWPAVQVHNDVLEEAE